MFKNAKRNELCSCEFHLFLQINTSLQMKIIYTALILLAFSCSSPTQKEMNVTKNLEDSISFSRLLGTYYEERLLLFPLEATVGGDNRYNDTMNIEFTESFRDHLKMFYQTYLHSLQSYQRDSLNENDAINYDVLLHEIKMGLESLTFHDNFIPLNQFYGLHLTLPQLGSGEGAQPFKSVQDYENWIKRASIYQLWTDSAIVYFKKGMDANYTLPATLVKKIIPQLNDLVTNDVSKSIFWGPVTKMPHTFSAEEKEKIKTNYVKLINERLVPSFKKLSSFLSTDYLPKARNSSGINDLPNGNAYYNYLVKQWTTTPKQPDEIYQTGLSEVKRIRDEMERVKESVGFKGDLNSFFEFLKTDKQFMPFKTAEEVLNAYRAIQKKIDPNLSKLFSTTPKTKFEIRQTEAFRAASASAEYAQGSADGTRPGIFYVPILDAKQFNVTSGMESLFLHEAIPGHHYQVSLQQENESLPKFRRFIWYGAYGEGWALYCESLGKELGLYTDPYQYMTALGDEIHRAIRLVVDVALHTGKMTREQAIEYMMQNEAIAEQGAVAEIERYMAIPAQALSYKIGALKIKELREKYQKQIGNQFSIAAFHNEVLKYGCLPLAVLEHRMDSWANQSERRN
jgi:uncharacterized protein (DUF885 family)